MNHWQIGNVKITRVVETENFGDMTMLLPEATAEKVAKEAQWLRPHFMDQAGRLNLSIQAFAIESMGRKIVVDTCIGNGKGRPALNMEPLHTSFLSDLEEAGFSHESVDLVLCTHLHLDHVGWNTMLKGGRWAPTFPNARYLISAREWEHWSASDDVAIGDSVRPVFEAGLVDLVEMTHQLTDEIRVQAAPGHTPGHVFVRISSKGQDAVITGDLMHHPIQCKYPDWLCTFDADPKQGCSTRRAFIEAFADRPVLVLGTHFSTPSAGYIRRDDGGYRFRAP